MKKLTGPKLANPEVGLDTKSHLKGRLLATLRAAPTRGGALRSRFGSRIAAVLADAHSSGLVLRDEAGDWWLTPAGREALRLDNQHQQQSVSA